MKSRVKSKQDLKNRNYLYMGELRDSSCSQLNRLRMSIDNVLSSLLQSSDSFAEKTQTLIFVLGDGARNHIEHSDEARCNSLSSINAVSRSRKIIDVLFLNRLQYLFMYLMKFEAEEDPSIIKYNNFVVYGLDSLIRKVDDPTISKEKFRLSNLIFNAAFRIKRKHSLNGIMFIPFIADDNLTVELQNIEKYWEVIC